MTDYGSNAEHANVVLQRLRDEMPSQIPVFEASNGGPSVVPTGQEPPYITVHISGNSAPGGRLPALSTRFVQRAFVHAVGATEDAARKVLDYVDAALVDYRPTIAGRSVYPIRPEPAREPFVTEPVARSTVEITAVYRLESDPGRQGS